MLIAFAIAVISFSYVFYNLGLSEGMRKAGEMLDQKIKEKFRNAGVVVKKDDRIIECNGMMIPMQCEKCIFGRVNGDDVECFAPDYDGVPVFGVTKKCERYGHLVHMTDECKGGHNAKKQKEGQKA